MEERFAQQLKKGVLEMLVLKLICKKPTYGYELLLRLKDQSGGLFTLKEGTLYPILYRLEDEKWIAAKWSQGAGRTAPKKIYEATDAGREENLRRQILWKEFAQTVDDILREESEDDRRTKENEALHQRH